ncbi:GTP cyclohydrolase II [Candidatus Woesearchaeota archaeon]|nr:GTP cyclohydrolase II [Candidatus Woesearchaeota archaeon]
MAHIQRTAQANIPTEFGEFSCIVYEINHSENHVALIKGDVKGKKGVLVRVHSQCLTGDVFHSVKCDCGKQLERAMHEIAAHGGVLLYLQQEGRGIGLSNKIKAYALQEKGYDTVEANTKLGFHADERDYTLASCILKDLGIASIKLMTNNPDKISSLEENGIKVIERIPLIVPETKYSAKYFKAKKEKMGHLLD